MERKIAIVLFLFIFCTMAYSQDILTMKSGEQSVVKIEGISKASGQTHIGFYRNLV